MGKPTATKKSLKTPWKTQSPEQIRQIAAAHSNSPISPAGLIALRFRETSASEIPADTRQALIRADLSNLTRVIKEEAGTVLHDEPELVEKEATRQCAPFLVLGIPIKTTVVPRWQIRSVLRDDLGLLPMDIQGVLAANAIRNIMEREPSLISKRMWSTTISYLRARKIPLNHNDGRALSTAINTYMGGQGYHEIVQGPDMRAIEGIYIRAKKEQRRAAHARATRINSLAKRIYGGQEFNQRQRLSIKKSVSKLDDPLIFDLLSKPESEFISSERARFSRLFKPQARKPFDVPISIRPSQTVKLGDREMRMVDHCLAKIASIDAYAAEALRRLLNEGLVNGISLNRLQGGGVTTWRVFIAAIRKHGFASRFGIEQVNHLIDGLAFLGRSSGTNPIGAIRAFGSPKAPEMLGFLEKNGLVTYLGANRRQTVHLETPPYY